MILKIFIKKLFKLTSNEIINGLTMNLITTDSTNYERLKKLGQGSFGSVFLVKNIKDGNIYVSKDINISEMEERNLIQMFAEAKILEALNHPYIIKLYEFYKTKS